MADQVYQIPPAVFYLIGFLIVSNLASFGGALMVFFKVTWWAAKLDSRVEKSQETGNRAHKRIDQHESVFHT